MTYIYKFHDDMDAAAMEAQRDQLENLLSVDDDLLIDLSEVAFIDSSGVGGLVFLFKRVRASGRQLTVTGLKGQPLQLLIHLGLKDLMQARPERFAQ